MAQSNNNTLIIIGVIETLILSIPTLILVWKSWEKKQSSVGLRIIRKKKEIRKVKLDSQTKLDKLKIELESLEQEAHYLNRINSLERGGFEVNEKSLSSEPLREFDNLKEQNLANFNESVKKGSEAVQKGTAQFKQGLGTLTSLKDKGMGQIDKGLEKVKGIGDQIKGLKDKFLGGSKKE